MMLVTALITAAAVLTTCGAGYLFGVRLGRRARTQLVEKLERSEKERRDLEVALTAQQHQQHSADSVRQELKSMLAPLAGQQASVAELHQQMQQLVARISQTDHSGEHIESLREEMRRALAPLAERDKNSQQDLRAVMTDLLSPLLESERRGQALQGLSQSRKGRGQLPTLLDSMARRGGFTAILITDDVGLPLASSAGAKDADVLAGMSSLILTLADRVTRSGGDAPTAVLMRDTSNALILHRIFTSGGERFVVTGVSKGAPIATDALDPALPALENALFNNKAA